MVECELGVIVRPPTLPEQRPAPGVVQASLVQEHESGVTDEIRPDKVVVRVARDFEDCEVIRLPTFVPDKVVSGLGGV